MIIQIVEDDKALNKGIAMTLSEPNTFFVQDYDIKSAENSFQCEKIELIILDINLPDGNGLDFLKKIRESSNIPVLILTANNMEIDEVMGLESGADDYLTKPFSLAVLRARINALIRRSQMLDTKEYKEDDFLFDFEKLIFIKKSDKIVLSPNEQKLLRILIQNKGRLLTREILVDHIWSEEGNFVDENALSVTINRLRSKLEDRSDGITYIQTIYGQGYMWKKTEGRDV